MKSIVKTTNIEDAIWYIVENATIRFISNCSIISHAIQNIIIDIQNAIYIKNENHISTKYHTIHVSIIPMVTSVNACIKDDTGIGPSIASGSHICNPN